jgi:hypothetical protein
MTISGSPEHAAGDLVVQQRGGEQVKGCSTRQRTTALFRVARDVLDARGDQTHDEPRPEPTFSAEPVFDLVGPPPRTTYIGIAFPTLVASADEDVVVEVVMGGGSGVSCGEIAVGQY